MKPLPVILLSRSGVSAERRCYFERFRRRSSEAPLRRFKSFSCSRAKLTLLILTIAAFLTSNRELHAQPVLDDFNPNVEGLFNIAVRIVVAQPDGKVLVGGLFKSVAPNGGPSVGRTNIARFNSDGSLDTNFDGNANSDIYAMALQPDGKILVGGYFTSIGGQLRNRIARLDPTNGLADAFSPNANQVVRTITLQTNGMILVGGDFSTIGGANRGRIARLDPASGLADLFNPSADSFGSVYSILPQTDGKILVGGTFTNIGGQFRNYAARLDPTTGLADSWNPDVNGSVQPTVYSFALQTDGKIVVAGFFDTVGGQPRANIARVDATNGLADSFNPGANTSVFSLAVQPDGKILVGGGFTFIGGQPRGHLARFNSSTGELDAFDPNIDQSVNSVALQTDGKILAGGNFTRASAQPRGRVARFATPQPSLNIQRAGTNVVLSWGTNFSGFTLESNTNFNTNVWINVSPVPTVNGTNNVVTNAASAAIRFYRLRQ